MILLPQTQDVFLTLLPERHEQGRQSFGNLIDFRSHCVSRQGKSQFQRASGLGRQQVLGKISNQEPAENHDDDG